MSVQNMTRLEAVNRILRAAKEAPVSSLGAGGESDSLLAEQILDEVNRREQMAGIHSNTIATSFIPDTTTHRVVLPNNVVDLKAWNQHAGRNFFFREEGGELRLFDGDKTPPVDTFEDDDEVYVRVVQLLEFEVLPLYMQFSIADQASLEYAEAVLPSNSTLQRLEVRAAKSRAIARARDMNARPHNMFTDSRSSGPRSGGRGVLRPWPYTSLPHQD